MSNAIIKGPSGKVICELKVNIDDDISQVQQQIHAANAKLAPNRQSLSFVKDGEKVRVEPGRSLKSFGFSSKSSIELTVKDLGPQIGWQTVFLIEYFGPIAIHAIVYWIYNQQHKMTPVQNLCFVLVVAHFVKRELETLFVHRFSHGTMPFMNVFKNSFHYWVLSGVFIAVEVYSSWYAKLHGSRKLGNVEYGLIAVWLWAQLSNFSTHVTLKNLRPAGTKVRKIPYGYGFSLVSCPNYFFETVGWVALCALTRSYAAVFFTIVATGQMFLWAIKKHKAYKKEFKDYPRNRKSMFPFIA